MISTVRPRRGLWTTFAFGALGAALMLTAAVGLPQSRGGSVPASIR